MRANNGAELFVESLITLLKFTHHLIHMLIVVLCSSVREEKGKELVILCVIFCLGCSVKSRTNRSSYTLPGMNQLNQPDCNMEMNIAHSSSLLLQQNSGMSMR